MSDNKNYISFEWIDTTESAKNFARLIEEKKTFFLNGKWGSGKTAYLKEVKKQTKRKFVNIDLWNIKDNRSVINIGTRKFHPHLFGLINLFGYLFVIIALLSTKQINLGIGRMVPISPVLQILITLIALSFTIWRLFKPKSDDIYITLLRFLPSSNKVLVFDDFDRVSAPRQEDAYKLFNILAGRVTIVFLGDYERISKNDGNYLQKIIDIKRNLPYSLQNYHVFDFSEENLRKLGKTDSTDPLDAQKIFISLEEEDKLSGFASNVLNTPFDLFDELVSIFVEEGRTLRERDHFIKLVNMEFFDWHKIDTVQPVQQLTIIYIYLFYPKYYSKLTSGWFPDSDDVKAACSDQNLYSKSTSRGATNLDDSGFIRKFYALLTQSTDYPKSFLNNKPGYWVGETTPNIPKEKLQKILENPSVIFDYIKSTERNDVIDWLKINLKTEKYAEVKPNFEEAAHNLINRGILNDSINSILRVEKTLLDNQKIYELYHPMVVKQSLEFKLHFFGDLFNSRDSGSVSNALRKYFSKEAIDFINSDNFDSSKDKPLILGIALKNINDPSFDTQIHNLNDNDYWGFIRWTNLVRVWRDAHHGTLEST
ncbi:MAG TPA: hypothetical protein DEP42_00290, partial [Ruminococcaceae bacterium]|nr:hypothetical protein [Oscillospiraceae bacterium]